MKDGGCRAPKNRETSVKVSGGEGEMTSGFSVRVSGQKALASFWHLTPETLI